MRQSVRCGGGRYGGEVVAEAWAVKKELGRCPMWSCVPGPGWAGVLVGVSMCPPLFLYCIPSSTRIVQGLCCGVTGAGGAAARCANQCMPFSPPPQVFPVLRIHMDLPRCTATCVRVVR